MRAIEAFIELSYHRLFILGTLSPRIVSRDLSNLSSESDVNWRNVTTTMGWFSLG